ncbi:hypothetical protein [Pseudonocardia asaccharolytica]|uniref:Uncharacterized protein n=1 Tax=Pseudonocardia asaccharolytica DSM 44247 = NBRC 16224 TaxID=1123024 RepID=A0A511D0X0_9PSEU|nr:hypothetical protein [Pseudonocardia asaccharolytica]GEL18442.1 hypothetical protein PA7_22790 [Pseudonocardia asaccharolytica DSM 44247 = NBRC 16224]
MSTYSVGQQRTFGEAALQAQQPRAGTRDESRVHAGTRMLLHLVLAGVPLLAISAQVFGFLPMRAAAALIIVPLVIVIALLSLFAPHSSDRIAVSGFLWGMAACVVYDVFRLDTVYLLGLWGDFIPTMGSWVTGGRPGAWDGAMVGYLWRYIGDSGGIGIAFFILAVAAGLGRRRRRVAVLAGVGFAVAPVWAGLIATVALAPRGQELMFPLTATTVTLSLVGHLIFGVVLGLGFWHSRGVQDLWSWRPVGGVARTTPGLSTTPTHDRWWDATGVEHHLASRGISRATYDEWQRELERRRLSRRRARTKTGHG